MYADISPTWKASLLMQPIAWLKFSTRSTLFLWRIATEFWNILSRVFREILFPFALVATLWKTNTAKWLLERLHKNPKKWSFYVVTIPVIFGGWNLYSLCFCTRRLRRQCVGSVFVDILLFRNASLSFRIHCFKQALRAVEPFSQTQRLSFLVEEQLLSLVEGITKLIPCFWLKIDVYLGLWTWIEKKATSPETYVALGEVFLFEVLSLFLHGKHKEYACWVSRACFLFWNFGFHRIWKRPICLYYAKALHKIKTFFKKNSHLESQDWFYCPGSRLLWWHLVERTSRDSLK